jgi:hypothetical protein
VPLRPLLRVPPVEQAQASLISGLDVDLVPPVVVPPAFLSFPSFLSSLLQAQHMPDLFVPRQEQFRSTNGPSRCFPVRFVKGSVRIPRCSNAASIWSHFPAGLTLSSPWITHDHLLSSIHHDSVSDVLKRGRSYRLVGRWSSGLSAGRSTPVGSRDPWLRRRRSGPGFG